MADNNNGFVTERGYKAPDMTVKSNPTATQPRLAGPSGIGGRIIQAGDSGWQSRMLQQALGNLQGLASEMIRYGEQSAYLRGKTDAMMGKSEEALEGYGATKMWSQSGYREVMGSVALAEAKQKFSDDIGEIAKMDTDEFKQYIEKRRAELLPVVMRMGTNERNRYLVQLENMDTVAVSNWTDARAKYIVGERMAAANTITNQSLGIIMKSQAGFNQGKIGLESHRANVQEAYNAIKDATVRNAGLEGHGGKLMTEAVMASLKNDDPMMYEVAMRDEEVSSQLDIKDRQRMADAYRQTQKRLEVARTLESRFKVENLIYDIENGVWVDRGEDLMDNLNVMVKSGDMTDEEAAKAYRKYLNYTAEDHKEDINLLAYDNPTYPIGNPDKGAKSVTEALAKEGKSNVEIANAHLLKAQTQTNPAAYKEAGRIMSKDIGVVRAAALDHNPDVPVNLQATESTRQLVGQLTEAMQRGNPGMLQLVLQGMDADSADFLYFVANEQARGVDFQTSLGNYKRAVEAGQKKTKQTVAQDVHNYANITYQDFLSNDSVTTGFFGNIWNNLKGSLGFEKKIGISGFNSDTAEDYMKGTAFSVMQEYVPLVAQAYPHLSQNKEALMTHAINLMMQKAVKLEDDSNLFVPPSVDVKKALNVNDSELALMKKYLTDYTATHYAPDDSWQYIPEFRSDGLYMVPISKDGGVTTDMPQAPVDVKDLIAFARNRELEEHDRVERVTRGERITHKDGADFRITGRNSIGLNPELFYQFQKTLQTHEGVRGVVYEDSGGTKAVGMGINSKSYPELNKYAVGEKVPNDVLESLQHRAVEDHARKSHATLVANGIANSPNAELLFFDLYYQGRPTTEQEVALIRAIKTGNPDEAVRILKTTAAYKAAGGDKSPRNKHRIEWATTEARLRKGKFGFGFFDAAKNLYETLTNLGD